MQERTPHDVAEIARRYFSHTNLSGIRFSVDEDRVKHRDHAWHIGVRPTHYPERMYMLYEEMAVVAEEIAEKEGLNVYFVLGEPLAAPVAVNS